jgi:hypothetical protein
MTMFDKDQDKEARKAQGLAVAVLFDETIKLREMQQRRDTYERIVADHERKHMAPPLIDRPSDAAIEELALRAHSRIGG